MESWCLSRKASWAFGGSAETPSTAVWLSANALVQPREVDGLLGAARGVRARIEEQHEFLAGEVGQRDRAAAVARQVEAGALAPSVKADLPRDRRGAAFAPPRCACGPACRPRPWRAVALRSRGPVDFNAFERAFAMLPASSRTSCLCCVLFAARPLAGLRLAGLGRCVFADFAVARGSDLAGRTSWGISCAFSWTYAFLSSLSADQSLGYCGSCPGNSDSSRLLGKSDGLGVWLQGIRRTTRPLVERAAWAG